MQFNPTSKTISIVADIDFLLFGDGDTLNTEYSLVDRARNVNFEEDEIAVELYKADPNFKWDDITNTNFPFATLTLVANQDHYTLLDTALVIHRVRIKDPNGVLVTLDPKLRSELSDSELNATGTPDKYYKIGGAVFPLPVPDYGHAAGVEVSFQRGANHFVSTDTTKEPGFNPQFHQLLSIGAALRYAIANGMSEKVKELEILKEKMMAKMLEHYQLRSPDERPKLKLKRSTKNYGL